MKKHRVRDKFIKELQRTPIIQVACDKMGISRQTYYRWYNEDSDFMDKVNLSISQGEGVVNDVAKSNILRGIQNGDKKDSKFWLTHRDHDFRKPFKIIHEKDDPPLFNKEDVLAMKKFREDWTQDKGCTYDENNRPIDHFGNPYKSKNE